MNKVTPSLAILLLGILTIFTSCSKDDETKIENWIVGTWNMDKYVQKTYSDGTLQGESESTNLGEIEFRKDGTGTDIGGNFIGSDFTWTNTDEILELTENGSTTVYDIEDFSETNFIFSITHTSGTEKEVERWFLSK
ncbi:MAG: hypothetical protein ACQEQ0_07575 [Bacteroidota bacterium]